MKKIILATITLFFAFRVVNAQENVQLQRPALGFGLEAVSASNKIGYGASVNFRHQVSSRFSLTAAASYLYLYSLLKVYPRENLGFIPIKVGAKYFISGKMYAQGELGAAFPIKGKSTTALIYSPGIGWELPVSSKSAIDVNIRYERWDKMNIRNLFAIKIAFDLAL